MTALAELFDYLIGVHRAPRTQQHAAHVSLEKRLRCIVSGRLRCIISGRLQINGRSRACLFALNPIHGQMSVHGQELFYPLEFTHRPLDGATQLLSTLERPLEGRICCPLARHIGQSPVAPGLTTMRTARAAITKTVARFDRTANVAENGPSRRIDLESAPYSSITTPHGIRPAGMEISAFWLFTSMTVTSSPKPFATKSLLSSFDSVMPQERLPTSM
jgi:hypothetical protein